MPIPANVKAFISAHLATAQDIQRRYGIPAGILLAQSALESGWGTHVIGNAYFGIKGKAPDGASTTFDTHEYINGTRVAQQGTFRAYTDFADAADDWAQQVRDNPRFRECYLRQRTTTCAMILARGGYGTDPFYARKLLSIIRTYRLDQYDNTAPQ
jgi:peptidoglycan hydrolase FlgJ